MNFFLQLLINGLLLGGFYATMTLGFSTIWGVMRLINLAHGEFLLVGAYAAWFFFNPDREQFLPIGEARLNMAVVMFVGLALAFGFNISHMLLGRVLNWNAIWRQRAVGYSVGAVLALALYLIWEMLGFPPIDPFLSLPLIFPLFFALGYVLQKWLFNRVVEGPYLTMLLVTFAVAIMLQEIGIQIYAADPRKINVDYGFALALGSTLTVAPAKLLTVATSGFMIAGLVAFLRYTRIGYAIRAAAQNKMAARLMGINIYEVYAITFGIALGLTAMAGAMMGTFQPVTPITGPIWTLRAFAIVALGGLGKVEGAVVGGLTLGLAESFVGGYVGIGWATAVAFIMLVVMLVLRPQGITGGLVAAEE